MSPNPDPILAVSGYSLAYRTGHGAFRVLEAVDLAIGRGEVVGLVGESGSGKSTLAYAVMRSLQSPVAEERGAIRLVGEDLVGASEARLATIRGKRVAMVFQDPGASLNPTLPLGTHMLEVLSRHRGLEGADATAEAHRLLGMVGLPDAALMMQKYPHEVSGGEKQRVVIAIAFACEPELILFDEATTALDATTAVTILDLFKRLQAETGVAALFIAHDLGVIAEVAHRVAVIYAGRIVEDAPVRALFREPRHPYTRALLASLPRPFEGGRPRTLETFPGPLPDRTAAPVPCVFEPRCPFATEVCRSGRIVLEADGARHTACARWAEVLREPLRQSDSAPVTQTTGESPPVLSLSSLEVRIGKFQFFRRLLGQAPQIVHAVTDASFTLHAGETLGLVGESGCGKSSLARAIAGLRDFEGTIQLGERAITAPAQMDRAYRARVQIVFQNPDSSLNPRQRIGTILGRPLRLYRNLAGGALKQAVAELLASVKLPADYAARYPHQLSGGEKQRVAIARAIATEPAVIICDEITSGLDASVQAAIVNLLREIQARHGIAYLFISHDLNLVRYLADRVITMYLGQLVEQRPARSLEAPPYHPYTEALLSSAPSLDEAVAVRRVRLEGAMPTRIGALDGCPFESRCPKRIGALCAEEAPPLRSFHDDHWLRCHLSPDALRTGAPIWSRRETGTAKSQREDTP